jgi:hypothetical protein
MHALSPPPPQLLLRGGARYAVASQSALSKVPSLGADGCWRPFPVHEDFGRSGAVGFAAEIERRAAVCDE